MAFLLLGSAVFGVLKGSLIEGLSAGIGFSFVVFFWEVLQYTPLGAIPVITQIKTVIYLSWGVFLASWLYHANYKGE